MRKFLQKAFGANCLLAQQGQCFALAFASCQALFLCSPDFISKSLPSIIWAITICTNQFFSKAITAANFVKAEALQDPPPRVTAELDIKEPVCPTCKACCKLS